VFGDKHSCRPLQPPPRRTMYREIAEMWQLAVSEVPVEAALSNIAHRTALTQHKPDRQQEPS